MRLPRTILTIALLAFGSPWHGFGGDTGEKLQGIDVAPVWAGHPVGFAIATSGEYQYVAFYDSERRMTVGQRLLDSAEWVFTTLPARVEWDSHNGIALELDCEGYVHVSGNMHGDRLLYFRSLAPHDISTLERSKMVGSLERKVTYPQFLRGGDGCLYFQYRHGRSGAGLRVLNRYDAGSKTWSRALNRELFDGRGEMSAYLSGPVVGPDGYFHLVWMWRDTPLGSTNHDLSYARSRDLVHWETVSGEPLTLPLTPRTSGVVVDRVQSGGGLVAIAFGVDWDRTGRPIVSYCKFGPDGFSQWFNARYEGDEWRTYQTSDWRYRRDLERTGALAWDIAVNPIGLDAQGRLTQSFDHVAVGRGVWILDEETLRPVAMLEEPDVLRQINQVESDFAGMEVRDPVFDRQGEYFLRWETLPMNRDRPRRPPYPPPSMLRVFRRPSSSEATAEFPTAEASLNESRASAPSANASVDAEHPAPPDADVETSMRLDMASLEKVEARIGEVTIKVADIFDESDPSENRRIFRLVNRLHPRTRDWVIREQLLFAPGDSYSARLLEESERQLRTRRYLYDAEIRPVRCEDGVVDIEVATRDVWTLQGGVGFSRAGGENEVDFKLEDDNFLGLGRKIGASHTTDIDRTSSEISYLDTNLFGTRGEIEIKLADNSDGDRQLLHLRRPFYALDARRTFGMSVLLEDRVDPIFNLGQLTSDFRHEIEVFEAYWGFSQGLREGSASRWKLGYTYIGDTFSQSPGRAEDVLLPPDRTLSYPWVDFELIQDRFVEARDLNRIARTEDINLGSRFQARLGWSSPNFGGDDDLAVMGFTAGTGFRPSESTLVFASTNGGARWGSGDFETVVVGGSARLFWRNFGKHALFAKLEAAFVEDLDPEKQLLLGGDSGLRGYPLRYQNGDRRFLVTFEQRFFSDLELFKLANVGAAVFFDAGRAWFADNGIGDDLGVLKDIGVGLRLSSSRSSGKSVLHFDIAFPLDGDDSIDGVQFLVETKQTL
ncbi:MAG: BNR-4 repeat-containing protein [Acidobacteriota bacterium]|nr:BNR-4 repeat-containing protein [Acidobacteriota bacterium]